MRYAIDLLLTEFEGVTRVVNMFDDELEGRWGARRRRSRGGVGGARVADELPSTSMINNQHMRCT